MGIRFQCHQCQHAMHVKDFLAGKKSRCPTCQTRFRIPSQGESASLPLSEEETSMEEGTASPTTKPTTSPTPSPSASPTPSVAPAPAAVSVPISAPVPAEPKSNLWLIRPPSGGQYGPATRELVTEWIQQRRVTSDSLVWCEGWQNWQPASVAFADLFALQMPVPPVPATVPPVAIPPLASNPAVVPDLAPAPASAPVFPVAGVSPASPLVPGVKDAALSPVQLKAMERIKKKKRRQLQMVAVLSILALILIVVLIVVLIWNPAVQPPSGAK